MYASNVNKVIRIFNAYLAPFPTTARTWEPKLNTWMNCTPRMLLSTIYIETYGIHGGLFVSLRCLEWTNISSDFCVLSFKIVLYGLLGNMEEFMLNRLGVDRWNYKVSVIRVFEEMVCWTNWVQIRGISDICIWTQGRALYYTCINWLDGRSSAIELSLMFLSNR